MRLIARPCRKVGFFNALLVQMYQGIGGGGCRSVEIGVLKTLYKPNDNLGNDNLG